VPAPAGGICFLLFQTPCSLAPGFATVCGACFLRPGCLYRELPAFLAGRAWHLPMPHPLSRRIIRDAPVETTGMQKTHKRHAKNEIPEGARPSLLTVTLVVRFLLFDSLAQFFHKGPCCTDGIEEASPLLDIRPEVSSALWVNRSEVCVTHRGCSGATGALA
jgi:hypothetical protein